jgi:hypothetical protein
MAIHIWTAICTDASVDNASNKLSMFNLVEEITLLELPEEWPVAIPIEFEIVTYWVRSDQSQPEKAESRLVFEGIEEQQIFDHQSIDLTTYERLRHRNRLSGMPVEGLGRVWFVTQLKKEDDWEEVARVPIDVKYRPPED